MTDSPQTPPPGAGDPSQFSPYQGQPAGAPMPPSEPVAPPAAPKAGGIRRIFSILVIVAVVGGGAFFLYNNWRQGQILQTGNCLTTSGSSSNVQIHEAKCDDTSVASWKIGEVIKDGSSCDAGYYNNIDTTKGSKTTARYCIQPNLAAGKCYAEDSSENGMSVYDCTSTEAEFKVLSVEEGEDESLCGDGEVPYVGIGIGVTYCMETVS